jgi:acyl-coenzyme A thioesterase PaaI-like protein
MGTPDTTPVSAARLAEQLGDALPEVGSVPDAAFALVAGVRALVDAVVLTDVHESELARATAELARITERLRARQRPEPLLLVRHPDGRVESLLQAGAGRLNPHALPIRWTERPTEPPPGSAPRAVECVAECTFTAAHAGSPGRAHGGAVAAALDECLGVAATAAGATGLTVALHVDLRRAVPLDRPVVIRARLTAVEGRKSHVGGEVLVDGEVAADATLLAVGERRS